MASALERFRARFRGLDTGPAGGTPDQRLRAAIDLHAFNLLLMIDKVRAEIADAGAGAVIAEVNRRRLASSPMPGSLANRLERDVDARSE